MVQRLGHWAFIVEGVGLMAGVRTKTLQVAQGGQIRKKMGGREEKLFCVQGKPFKKKKQHTVPMFK